MTNSDQQPLVSTVYWRGFCGLVHRSSWPFNQTIAEGYIPQQWKTAIITPVPKISKPTQPIDFRPISITSVLSRSFEKHIVRTYIYPALQNHPPGLHFNDQFAFRPTGATTVAVIALFHIVLTTPSTNYFLRVFALDFSKAFDTIRHATLMVKMVLLDLPDQTYSWIKDFFDDRSHCTKYSGKYRHVQQFKPVSYKDLA